MGLVGLNWRIAANRHVCVRGSFLFLPSATVLLRSVVIGKVTGLSIPSSFNTYISVGELSVGNEPSLGQGAAMPHRQRSTRMSSVTSSSKRQSYVPIDEKSF